jgi:hypothetical protein
MPQRRITLMVVNAGGEPVLPAGPAAGEPVTLVHGTGHQFPHPGGVEPQLGQLTDAQVTAGVAPEQQRRTPPQRTYRADQPAPCGAEQHHRGLSRQQQHQLTHPGVFPVQVPATDRDPDEQHKVHGEHDKTHHGREDHLPGVGDRLVPRQISHRRVPPQPL